MLVVSIRSHSLCRLKLALSGKIFLSTKVARGARRVNISYSGSPHTVFCHGILVLKLDLCECLNVVCIMVMSSQSLPSPHTYL